LPVGVVELWVWAGAVTCAWLHGRGVRTAMWWPQRA